MVFISKDESGNFVCPCGYNRAVKFNVQRHMLTCKTVKAATMQVDETEVAALKESLAAKDLLLTAATERADSLATENDELKQQIRELKKRKSGSVTNITNNITVNLTPFQEFRSHRGRADICAFTLPDKELVRSLLRQPESVVPKYIEAKYFTTETPSITLPNVKKPELRVVEKGRDGITRWVTVDKDSTIETIVDRGIDELENTYKATRVEAYAQWLEREGLDANGFNHAPAYKKMKKDVEAVILKNRKSK